MRGNIVVAAVILGVALVVGCGVLVLGAHWVATDAVDRWMARFEVAVRDHGRSVETSIAHHARAVEDAGQRVGKPEVTFLEPVPIREPLKVRGVKDDGALPVDATIAK